MAAQRLSGCGVRHPEPPVLVLVRAESGLDPYVPLSTRDSRLPRAGRRRVRPAQAPAAGHWSAQCALGIRCVALADGIVRRRHRPRRRRGERRRAVQLGAVSRHRRAGRLHRHADAHRTMGYDGRSGRQEGGRHRNRRQRRTGRTRTRRRRRRIDGLPAHTAMDGAEGGPSLQRGGVVPVPPPSLGVVARTVAAVEAATRQHRVDPEPPAVGRRRETVRGIPAQARRRRTVTRRPDTPIPVPLQAGSAGREVLHRTATTTTSTWSPTPSGMSPTRPSSPPTEPPSTSTPSCWRRVSKPAATCRGST